MIHQHNCSHCGAPLTCCCPSPLQMDRMTGKDRVFECIDCMKLGEAVIQDALLEAWERAKAEVKL